MSLERNKLSAIGAKSETRPGRHSDGGNLYLNVTATGARSWVFMYRFAGKQREMGLGSLLDVKLAQARDLAARARQTLKQGSDPLELRRRVTVERTFGEAADAYVEAMRPQWSNRKHAEQWTMTLRDYAAPLRGKPLQSIDTADVLEVLKPLWQTKPETAGRVRGRIESVLDAAKAAGHRSGENPARWRGHLDQLLPRRQKLSRGHHEALPIDDVPRFMARVRARSGAAARALEFTILTAARTGETIGAQWDEFDLDRGVWTVPAARMKAKTEHRVPLSASALRIIRGMGEIAAGEFVFPGAREGKGLSNMSMDKVLRLEKLEVTVHGFRSTFRDWGAERTEFAHELLEMALAHTIKNKAEAAYRRGAMIEKRRALMEAWAAFCVSVEDLRTTEAMS